jgi:hypothetical protein
MTATEPAKVLDYKTALNLQGDDEQFDGRRYGMFNPRLIGLHGAARSGKDTVGQMLADSFNVGRISFAEPIRNALRGMLGLTDEHFHGSLKEVVIPWLGKSPRQLMQTLGTEWGRGLINPDIWLLLAQRSVDDYQEQGRSVVITDVRFENEADLIRAMGGQVWHIHRPNVQQVAAHASESGIAFLTGDRRIDNNSSLEDLCEEVCDAFLEF